MNLILLLLLNFSDSAFLQSLELPCSKPICGDYKTAFSVRVTAKQAISDINTALQLDEGAFENKLFVEDCEEVEVRTWLETLPDLPINRSSKTNNTVFSNAKAYPNPSANGFSLEFFNPFNSDIAYLTVFNPLGKVIFEQKSIVQSGSNLIEIPSDAIRNSGIYTLKLATKGGAHFLARATKI